MAASETEHRAPRRQWSLAEKRRIVELTLVAGASTRSIAIEQGVHPTSLSHWKSLYRSGKLDAQPTARVRATVPSTTFMPVSIAPAVRASQRSTPGCDADARRSVVQLMLASGATLRLETDGVDAALVCALVAELRR